MTRLIAEIGWNHMGDLKLAKQMILEAALAGASVAKFQTWSVSRLKNGPWDHDGRREIYEKAELTLDDHEELNEFCKKHSILFASSVFAKEDVNILLNVTNKLVKIPSFEAANKDLIKECIENFEHVIVSTGTCTWDEVKELSSYLPCNSSTVMHCVSSYPCEAGRSNLQRIKALKGLFADVGYSDHVSGIRASQMALEFGLTFIEKHFTTSNELPGRDNKFAILPEEMHELSNYINEREQAMEDLGNDFQDIESESRSLYRSRFGG